MNSVQNSAMQRTVLISGVSSGIGATTAQRLSARGDRVLGLSRRAPPDGTNIAWHACDVRDALQVQAAVSALLPAAATLDAVLANAGVGGPFASVEEADPADVRELFDTNYFGVVNLVRAALPRLRAQRSGRIVITGSLAGRVPLPFQSHYAATKSALESFAFALRCEVAAFGIGVSLLEPGDIRTPINDSVTAAAGSADSPYARALARCAAAVRADVEAAPGPQLVAALIERILDAARPRARYAVGPSTLLVGLARRALPEALNLALVRQHFGL
jgi:NAD(P)-dependent dehydrogenase (short-subunit alcohol dehydrogenase family)